MRHAIFLLAATLLPDDPVDPALVGTWQSAIKNEHGEWTLTFRLEASGAYRTSFKGPVPLPDETGTLTGAKGKWSVVKASGLKDGGTYALTAADTASFTSPTGTVIWKRVPAAPPPPPRAEERPAALLPGGAVDGRIVPDKLAEPIALPKGRLDFLQGLDLLGKGEFAKAGEAFGRAAATDEENSDFIGLQGTALVLGEKVREGMALLDRALRLNPKNLTASRMTGFALRMQGDPINAAKFHGHGSTQDLDLLMVETASDFGRSAQIGKGPPKVAEENKRRVEEGRRKFPLVGATLAAGYRTGDQASIQAEYALGVAAFRSKEYVRALPMFRSVLEAYPFEWSAVFYYGWCAMETGNAETGRSMFTYALSYLSALPEVYAGRVLCAARQGGAERVKRDLAVLAELDPGRAKSVEVEAAALGPPAADDLKALGEKLRTGADTLAFEELVPRALELRRAMNARRLRYDELYQEGLRERSWALKRAPQNPDRLVDLADYLHAHRDVPALQVSGPNGPVHSFRLLSGALKDQEANFAQSLCTQALKIDPKHARAMTRKAAILLDYTALPDYKKLSHPYGSTPETEAFPSKNFGFDRLQEIEKLCLAATQIDPKIAEAHDLLSDAYREYAAWQRHQARILRNPVTWIRVVDADNGNFLRWDWKYRPPTPEEAAKAEALERQAAENDKRKISSWARMAEAARGTPRESYYAALDARLRGDDVGARSIMERGVQARPNDPFLRKNYASTLRNLGQEAEYTEEHDRYVSLLETSAEVWLKVAWEKIQRNAWRSVESALDRAAEKDPADARIAAYRGVAAEAQERWPEAIAWYRVALALEEARARLNGTSFQEQAPPGPDFRTPEDFGLTWAVRLKYARAVFFSDPPKAASIYMINVANEARLSEWQFSHAAATAMLPDPRQDPKVHPGTPMTATILLESRRLAGQSLVRAGKPAEGLQQLGLAETYASRLPGGGTAYLSVGIGAQYMPYPGESAWMWARLAAARGLLEQGNATAAQAQLDPVRRSILGRASNPNDPAEAEYNRLAPKLGLPVTGSGAPAAKADPAKVDPALLAGWKGYFERDKKGMWLTYQFNLGGDYTVTLHPIPGTQKSIVSGTFEASGGKLKMTELSGKASEGTYQVEGGRTLLLDFSGQKIRLERQ